MATTADTSKRQKSVAQASEASGRVRHTHPATADTKCNRKHVKKASKEDAISYPSRSANEKNASSEEESKETIE